MKFIRVTLFIGLLQLFGASLIFAQTTGSVGGQVQDGPGAVVFVSTDTAVAGSRKGRKAGTNSRGEFAITGLVAGKYTVRAIAPKFALYENTEVTVTAGERTDLPVVLIVSGVKESVNVETGTGVSTDPNENASATVIKGKDLDALPDDPDELEAALQALAGPSAGPNGGQIYIDGFTGGRIPPKDAIREIRINQNPFSAEYDRIGFGRVEILTKPGSDKFRGQVFGNFNDESLNSRNPFAVNRAPSQTRFFGGNVSGPITKGKSSYFFDFSNRDVDNNTLINAQVLDPSFNIVGFRRDVRVPTRRTTFAPRFDYQINAKNTLVARYSFTRTTFKNQGIGDTSLLSRAYQTSSREHEIRLTETMIINPKTVNETRFEYSDSNRRQRGDNTIPTVNVASAFIGGGAQIGLSFNHNRTFELNNFTTTSFGKHSEHSIKFGGRLRHVALTDRSENNFGGTFVFSGLAGSDACDINGDNVLSSIEQYRCKVMGVAGSQYNPTQFSITIGNPVSSVSQWDGALFASDDWKVNPALLLSFGLRYENQTNISSKFHFASRFGFAWSPGPGGATAPKTVFRGGAGVFYDRFSENFTLQALRFNGSNQLNLNVSATDGPAARLLLAQAVFNPDGSVTNVPTAAQILQILPASSTIRRVAPSLEAPYTIQGAVGVERQLPAKTTLAAFFVTSRILHQLRTRNINAPVCATPTNCAGAHRPDQSLGNIYEYESSGRTNQNQMIINFRSTISPKYSLFGFYRLGFSHGDTDGAASFPAYTYDLTGEYGRSSGDIRHNFIIGGNFTLPWKLTLNPFVTAFSGRPFNITTGVDSNGDFIFNERPTFGQLAARCAELGLTASYCNIGSNDPGAIIPRNYGQAPGYFAVNMRVSRNFGFGGGKTVDTAANGQGGRNGRGGNRGGGGGNRGGEGGGGGGRIAGGPGMMMGGFGGGSDARKPYNLNVGVNFTNIFNNVNLNAPVGALNSNRFGQSTGIAGGFGGFGGGGGPTAAQNRKIELQLRFSW